MDLLIVVDMQNDFIDGALGTKEAVIILPKVTRLVETFDGAVIFTRDTHTKDYIETMEGKNLPVVHCVQQTHGWELASKLADYADRNHSMIIDKPTFGSMSLPELIAQHMTAKGQEITSITLVGLCTDICVISNAMILKAAFYETPIKVLKDCCAGVTVASHENALNAMRMCQIEIV